MKIFIKHTYLQKLSISIILCLLLCSCTASHGTDAPGFCERLNKTLDNELLNADGFLVNGKCFDYYFSYFGRAVLLELEEDEPGRVKSACLTLAKDNKDLSQSEKEELLKLITGICAVLTDSNFNAQSALLADKGVTANILDFSEKSVSLQSDKYDYFLFCNSEIVFFDVSRGQPQSS